MTVTYVIKEDAELTPEQIKELEEAENYPIVYDDDCPPPTEESLAALRRAAAERNKRLTPEQKKKLRELAWQEYLRGHYDEYFEDIPEGDWPMTPEEAAKLRINTSADEAGNIETAPEIVIA